MTRLLLLFSLAALTSAETFNFTAGASGEMTADIELAAPGADWAKTGSEASMVDVSIDGKPSQQIMVYAGATKHVYRVFLGKVAPGDHELSIRKNDKYSAPNAGLEIGKVRFAAHETSEPYYQVLAFSPVLFARQNTVGKFTDVPLVVYCEKLDNALQYTVIFSNEDGGTSTRALMARWGRTTDIEYVYRVTPSDGKATIQSRGHKEIAFEGQKLDSHPLLIPVTDNNMVSGEATSAIRYQIAPVLVDLKNAPREKVMDDNPITYTIAFKEMRREAKLRPFGVSAGEKISDPSNYLNIDYKVANNESGVNVIVRRKGDSVARSSNLGRTDIAIDRDGWVRTTVELPPATKAADIAEVLFECVVAVPKEKGEPFAHSGECRIEAVGKAFFVDPDGKPGPNLWSKPPAPATLRTGESAAFEW